MLNSDRTKKHVRFLDEATCFNDPVSFQTDEAGVKALESVPVSALKVMWHPNGTESTIRHSLMVTECYLFKVEIEPFLLNGPFEP